MYPRRPRVKVITTSASTTKPTIKPTQTIDKPRTLPAGKSSPSESINVSRDVCSKMARSRLPYVLLKTHAKTMV